MSTELRPSLTDDSRSPKDLAYQPYQDIQAPPSAKAAAIAESDTPAEEEELQPPSDFTIHFPAYLPTPPFIHIQGVPNFRDIGGYSCPPPPSVRSRMPSDSLSTAKYMVRRNLLFRCAHPTQLTPLGGSSKVKSASSSRGRSPRRRRFSPSSPSRSPAPHPSPALVHPRRVSLCVPVLPARCLPSVQTLISELVSTPPILRSQTDLQPWPVSLYIWALPQN